MTAVSKLRPVRVRHELKMRDIEVIRIEPLSPHFRSITFRGPDLDNFVSASFDDHLKVFIGAPGQEAARRDYTPRRHDAVSGELTIEFALHGDGPAAEWAEQAAVGQHLGIGGPRGSLIIPVDYDWHLLIGDDTALPAIARRLHELPATTRAIVMTHTRDPRDRRQFTSAARLEQRWFGTCDELLSAVRAFGLPEGDGFAWCAGESGLSKSIRRVLVTEKGHDRDAVRAAAYWKLGTVSHHENLED